MVVAEKPSKELQELADRIDAEILAFKAKVLARPNASEFTLREIYSDVFQSGALLTPFGFVDGAVPANTVVGWTLNNPLEIGTQAALYAQYRSPDGSVMGEGIGTPEDGAKVDGSAAWQTGVRGAVLATGHALATPPRKNGAYMGQLPFTLVPYQRGEVPLGSDGGFIPVEGGGGELVDYARVDSIVRTAIGLGPGSDADPNSLLKAISGRNVAEHGSFRQGIEDKVKDALTELFNDPPQTDTERIFQERFFEYVKNANAGVQLNIIDGGDAWGQARREGLVQIVLEALLRAVAKPHVVVTEDNQQPYVKPDKG